MNSSSRDHAPTTSSALDPQTGWRWRNCRSVGLRLEFWPLDWMLEAKSVADAAGGEAWVHVGPLGLTLCFNVGAAS